MKGLNMKPSMFVVISISLLFLITAPLLLPDMIHNNMIMNPAFDDKPKWTGVINIWYIPYIDVATGNQISWMNSYIRSFEKQHPGVFIDLKVMSLERLALYFYGGKGQDFLPDMVSLGTYNQIVPEGVLLDLSPYFSDIELGVLHKPVIDSIKVDDRLIGIPWMIGAYGLYINDLYKAELSFTENERLINYNQLDKVARGMSGEEQSGHITTKYFGFSSYITPHTRPLLSIIYSNEGKINSNGFEIVANWLKSESICPPNLVTTEYPKAFSLFAVQKRTGILLGSNKVLYDLRRLERSGKGIDFTLFPIPYEKANGIYQDQIAAIGILDKTVDDVKAMCIMFLKGLLETKQQEALTELGMFSVIKSLKLYEDDEEMFILEESLSNMSIGSFYKNKETVNYIWEELLSLSQNDE